MSNTNLQVAQTILRQLGGQHFQVMVGAKNLVGSENSLSFRFMNGGCCRIVLNGNDFYDLEFFKLRKSEKVNVKEVKDIDCENLRRVFEGVTGLATSL